MIKVNQVKAHLSLDKWRNIGEEGKNSDVWIARDKQLEQVLILKKITKKSLDQQLVEDYFAEAKILNESRHPHIMPVYYSAEDNENVYITMPYYSNGSLNGLMNKRFLSVREIIRYSLDFLSGLLFTHIKGLLHLDIKPTNLIINDSDRILLTDFGLSKYLNETGSVEQLWQYVAHRSPESYDTVDRTISDDIYQAGLTLYRMCNGNELFKEQFDHFKSQGQDVLKRAVQKGEFPSRRTYKPHIPLKLIKVINKMLHPDPDKRYKEVLSIINDLSKIDEMLDWYYSEDENIQWVLESENSFLTVFLENDNGEWLTRAEKYVKSSQRNMKQTKFKGSFKNIDKALRFIAESLKNHK
ncbi:serine/threonine-protein kinase [Bacillus sp. KH172YL63]|uniref:serine/threonine-protein kinase n=1 Tax=Bacillus sp. KH172YL63 TaxID=2709784 RepID=UPI0013E4AB94|nr:serine/threonine-protein kinase [Bacillus sp. KH172YL63]BCB03515.1 hypothetical protein KH172YL63_16480 [Bacillus sp. KH172YL63]